MIKSKKRITYKKVRLALFLHSYGAHLITELLKKRNKNYKKLNTYSISRLSEVLNLERGFLKGYFINGKYPRNLPKPKNILRYSIEKRRVLVYLEIEKELLNLILEKEDWQGTALEDYNRALVEPAIERAAGNHMPNISDDSEFEEKLFLSKMKYRTYYYNVTEKYKLPTLRTLPFVLRLVS